MSKHAAKADKSKNLFWLLHHWVGLYTGILIGILSLTGALAVFIPEIDSWIVKHHYEATSTAVNGTPRFGRSVHTLTQRFPDYRSLTISLPEAKEQVAKVDLVVGLPGNRPARYDFFIDAGNDRLVGQRDHQNSLANYLRQMHVRLYEGYWGRQLVGIGGLALAIVAITGLIIYGNFMKKQSWPNIRQRVNLRIAMADWHKILGISALAFNLVIALTGAWLGLQPQLMRWFNITTPNSYEAPVVMEPTADRQMAIDWEKALAAANTEFPDLQPRHLLPSTDGSGTILIRGNISGLIYERDINSLVLSKATYAPVFKYDVRTQSFADQFYFIQEALHFGDFGGLMLKLIYALLGLTSGFLSISGFVIYIYRRKKKKQATAATTMKIIVAYTMLVILFLTVIALISLFVGYAQASFLAGILINTLLVALLLYALIKYGMKTGIKRLGRR
ncbi:PepSY-associated TM helix domain-containing protein [Parapedobacter lycopersici]|uniref:PepSY-associated TM helix domain-containing protein n=1 Tax=Parapedobacter lycopersici TaxID=1864939 RepID=UPI00214DC832|nr:PepSY-associated TM helix domain-containing protein [Parapedobacter lycopersici]